MLGCRYCDSHDKLVLDLQGLGCGFGVVHIS